MRAPDATNVREIAARYGWLPSFQMSRLPEAALPVLVRGDGARVCDSEGNDCVDAFAGLAVVNIGYGRDEVVDVIEQQLRQLHFVNQFETVHDLPTALAARISELSPWPEGARSFFVSGGSEAVEAALKIARAYHRRVGSSGRYKVVARRYGYHGVTMGALSLQGIPGSRATYEPLVPGARHVPIACGYRCDYHPDTYCCNGWCVREIERLIEFEEPQTIAAIILEPVQNVGGALVPPDDYLPRVASLCREHGILLIVDSVICSMGRIGSWLGFEEWGIEPDLVTVSKGLTSGYFPLGAVIARGAVADAFLGDERAKLDHGHTFGGLPAACAAALKVLEITEDEKLLDVSLTKGALLYERLREALSERSVVGDVRGRGLFGAVEFVADRDTATPYPHPELFARHGWAAAALRERGVIARVDNRLRSVIQFAPPLVLTEDDLDRIVNATGEVAVQLEEAARRPTAPAPMTTTRKVKG